MSKYQKIKTAFEDYVAVIAYTRPFLAVAAPFFVGIIVGLVFAL